METKDSTYRVVGAYLAEALLATRRAARTPRSREATLRDRQRRARPKAAGA